MNKHTPGPWTISDESDDFWMTVIANGKIVANVNPETFYSGVCDLVEMPVNENARLIAAAPELLEALKEIVSLEHSPMNFGVARTIARSAIAKARGEA